MRGRSFYEVQGGRADDPTRLAKRLEAERVRARDKRLADRAANPTVRSCPQCGTVHAPEYTRKYCDGCLETRRATYRARNPRADAQAMAQKLVYEAAMSAVNELCRGTNGAHALYIGDELADLADRIERFALSVWPSFSTDR